MNEQAPPVGRRERKKQEVQARIRDAAHALFQEKGYEATTVEEIAERADVAKGTFFNYYPRKDALLQALAEDMLDQLDAQLGPPEAWAGTAREQLLRFFLAIGEFVRCDPELSKTMMVETMRSLWMRTEPDPVEEEFRRIVRTALVRAAAPGELRPGADVEAAARLLEAAFHATTVEWLRDGTPEGVLQAALTAQFDIIFRGLGACGDDEGRTR
jgi:TetR/AcrR family transcriptional regulator, cholesterol catabolism regulator